jgi:zinc D-Ala-D-Ala carboxypeptidase
MDFDPAFPASLLEHSDTALREGISNPIPPMFRDNAMRLSHTLAMLNEAATQRFGRGLTVSSAYRSPALNQAVGGVPGSDHLLGLAADIEVPGVSVETFAAFCEEALYAAETPYHQLINEYGRWVHVGLAKAGNVAAFEKLTAVQYKGPTGRVSTIYRKVTTFRQPEAA